MKTHSIPNQQVIHYLKPRRLIENPIYETDLSGFFCDILQRANDLVPSEAGLILLRDATMEEEGSEGAGPPPPEELIAVASFGEQAASAVGHRLPADQGSAGLAYRSGQVSLAAESSSDRLMGLEGADDPLALGRSVISLPLSVRGEVVGVLELLSHREGEAFSERELALLEIFAHTLSVSIANAVEAQRSKEMARRDDLTHLYNDRYLHHSLTSVLKYSLDHGVDCGIIFLDLDYFKTVNDRFGHLAGSRVLREVGGILRQVLPGPAVPARYGGDEFVVILPESGAQETFWVAETIRKSIEDHVFLDRADPQDPINYPALKVRGHLTCSLGLATLQADILPLFEDRVAELLAVKNEILRVADGRMYRAKEMGRNRTLAAKDPH
jgi:diguanylate cyclase (GGDEF)-like protein